MSKPFKLSAVLYGHSLDVRSVYVTPDDSIVSGSRDKTAKLWINNVLNNVYNESMTYKDQKNFVGSVLYLEPSEEYDSGLVVTGGNDNTILIYKPAEPFATLTLKEHTNAVCCLVKGIKPNSFISGSWDTTAKYWMINVSQASVVTFIGHTAAIWSVLQLQNENIVTASADKTVGVWSSNGQRLKTLHGHTDCVRSLADFPELNYFISVSNDASIKVWTYTGENVENFYGHTNYIYSISRNRAGGEACFVTSDEDRTVRYWQNGVNTQTFQLPAQSIWSVACLSNGDIVTGSSDGVVRIFTQDESRLASEVTLKTFDEEVASLTKQSTQEIGGYKVSDLPGREALYDPGKKAGQMKMIREAQAVVAYTWVEDGENSHWEKVGDVLGGTDKNNAGKTMFEGQAYDFVFSVDVEDGKPPVKLPYNKGDDPYQAAHKFLTKNMLPPVYLDQVVDFILKNSKDPNEVVVNSEYVDPFTGASRYTPASSGSSGFGQAGANVDPFTGANSYSSGNQATVQPKPTAQLTGLNLDPFTGGSSYNTKFESNGFFPQMSYRTFDMGDPNIVLIKLKEFKLKYGDNNVDEASLENVVQVCVGPSVDQKSYDVLFKLLVWPDDIIFPVLDVIRMAVRYKENNEIIATRNNGCVMEKLKNYVSETCKIINNTLVAFRTLSNLFLFSSGENLIFESRFELLENITTLGSLNKNTQIAMATFLLNTCIMCLKRQDEVGVSILANVLPDIISNLEDPEAQFRSYVALGTLITSGGLQQNIMVKAKVKENEKFMQKLEMNSVGHNDIEMKRAKCVVFVRKELQY